MPLGRLPGVDTLAIDLRPLDLLDPAQEAVARRWMEVHASVQRELFGDRGHAFSLQELQAFHRAPERRRVDRAAYVDGELVGALEVIMPTTDNLRLAFLMLSVQASARRRGVGTALLAEGERIAREHGRAVLMVETDWAEGGVDLGEAFAQRGGFEVGQTMLRNVMPLREGRGALESVVDAPGAEDYAFESFVDQMPEAWLDQRAVLAQRMSTDAPVDDLAMEEEVWDADRLRGTLDRLLQSGRRIVETVARHVPSGDLVGFTQLNVSANDPTVAYQQDTLVLTEHRGHGLGLRLKAANALLLADELPDVELVRTWNSTTNEHMLAVNRALGYVVDGYQREWQKTLQ
jgi:GNAT superfamily N-acetyltransferase